MSGRLIRIVDSCESPDLALPRLGIKPFRISRLTYLYWRVHEDLDKAICSDCVPYIVAGRPIGAYRGTNNYTTVAGYLRGYEANPADIRISIILVESETL